MSDKIKEKLKEFFSIDNDNKIVVISLVINFIVCLASYSAFIVNGFVSPDGITEGMHVFTNQDWQLGGGARWAYVIVNQLRANLVFHWYTIIECFLVDWLSAHIINKIMNNKNKILYCISCAFFSVIPPIISWYTYIYSSFPVHLAILFSVIFVYLNQQKNIYLSILASIFLGFGMGTYQAFIGLPVGLIIICFIIKLLNDEEDKYKFLLKSILSGIGGGVVYVLGLNICLKIMNIRLYDRAATFSFARIINNLLPQIKENYYIFLSIFAEYKFKRIYIYIILFVIFALELLGIFVNKIKEKQYLNLLLIFASIAILPICFNFIGIIMPNIGIDNLEAVPDYIFIFLIICLKDYIYFDAKKITTIIMSICLMFLSWTFVLSANATYDSYRISYSFYKDCFQSALNKVYDLDGYELNKTHIVVIGYPIDETLRSNIRIYDYAEGLPIKSLMCWADANEMIPIITRKYLKNVFGVDTRGAMSDEDYEWFSNLEDVKAMPTWPNKGYVQMVDGYAVIKFCEVYE